MKKTIVILVYFILWPTFVFAQTDNSSNFRGTWLYARYLGYKSGNAKDFLVYTYYISGVVEEAQLANKRKQMDAIWCAPDGVASSQYFNIVGHYLELHPELRLSRGVALINDALMEAWPCDSR